MRRKLAPQTHGSYLLGLQYAERLRTIQLTKLALHHLTGHETWLSEDATGRHGRRLSPLTVSRYLWPIKGALQWAVDVQLLGRNPAGVWEIPEHEPRERPAFSREEAARYFRAVERSRWRVHLLVFAVTGLRLSEVRGLRIQDVNLVAGTYQVYQQWQRVMKRTTVEEDGAQVQRWHAVDVHREALKSKAGKRGGWFPDPVTDELRRWVESLQFVKRRAGRTWKNPETGALLLPHPETGGPFNAEALRNHHYRLLRDAKLPPLHLLDLRHTWVTLQLEAGTAEHMVPHLAGHSPRVNEAVYRHATEVAGKIAADRFWAYIHEIDESPDDEKAGSPKS